MSDSGVPEIVTALGYYQQSLTIDEELGNRAGMAASYHQLGRVAQDRGDYETALGYYQQSLTIKEELRNRAGMASTTSQLGVLAREQGRPRDAIQLHLEALSVRAEIESPDIVIDVRNLALLRTELGAPAFAADLDSHLDPESSAQINTLLDQIDAADE